MDEGKGSRPSWDRPPEDLRWLQRGTAGVRHLAITAEADSVGKQLVGELLKRDATRVSPKRQESLQRRGRVRGRGRIGRD